MTKTRWIRGIAVVGLGCLFAGLVLWPIPYNDVAMLSRGFLLAWLAAAAVVGFASRWILPKSILFTAGLVAYGYGLAVFGRVVFEGIGDPTSHNLWPSEVGIALAVGLVGGIAGGAVGCVVRPEKRA